MFSTSNNNTDETRLKWLNERIEELGLRFPVAELSRELGFNKGNVSAMLNGSKPISENFFTSFIKHYNKPYNTNEPNLLIVNDAEPVYEDIMQIPIVEASAHTGYSRGGFADSEYIESLPRVFVTKEYDKGNYVAFVIKGDSMDDGSNRAICENDRVLAKELPKMYWNDKLHYKQYIFIIVYNGGCVCKEITNHDVAKGEITLHSWNQLYEDRTIKLKDVYQLFYVKKIVEKAIKF